MKKVNNIVEINIKLQVLKEYITETKETEGTKINDLVKEIGFLEIEDQVQRKITTLYNMYYTYMERNNINEDEVDSIICTDTMLRIIVRTISKLESIQEEQGDLVYNTKEDRERILSNVR